MSKKKYSYCVMWHGDDQRGMIEILRNTRIKTYVDAAELNKFLQKNQGDDELVITNWKYLGRQHHVEEPTP